MIVRQGVELLLCCLIMGGGAIGQGHRPQQNPCDTLKHDAVPLSSQQALKLAFVKKMPLPDKRVQHFTFSVTLIVNQEGVPQCVLDNSPAETMTKVDVMSSVFKALEAWRFNPLTVSGRPRPFFTSLSFLFEKEEVTVR